MFPRVRLHRSLHRAIRSGHPWVYRDAVDGRVPAPGTEVIVVDAQGRPLGHGLAESGPIAVRMWTVDDHPIDDALLGRRIDDAVALRRATMPRKTDAIRLIHGEGDRMPGVVVDLYGPHGVLALDGEAVLEHRERLVAALRPRLDALGVHGLLGRWGRRGERVVERLYGEPPPPQSEIREHGMRLWVDLHRGQKTGFFLDQRQSRAIVRRIARGRRVLDLYSYVGGFSVAAGKGGAQQVTTVDLAKPAIELARRSWALNELPASRHRAIAADVPTLLRDYVEQGERFELIIADPPSFAPSADARERALRSYEKLHRACLQILSPGGLLLAGSCSSHVDRPAFEGALTKAAAAERCVVQVVDRWAAPPDHPRLLAFPEGDYLTCTLARRLDR